MNLPACKFRAQTPCSLLGFIKGLGLRHRPKLAVFAELKSGESECFVQSLTKCDKTHGIPDKSGRIEGCLNECKHIVGASISLLFCTQSVKQPVPLCYSRRRITFRF